MRRDSSSIFSACCGCKDWKDCISRISDPMVPSAKGFISPGVFIPALEDSGHISELDLYVLDSVNEFQKKRYQSDKITVPVSTNLSWMDFYDETIMNWLERKCADTSIPSGLSRMEITETSYAAIEADRSATLEALREAGILLLLDDFGSGYSSFGMLQNYNLIL